MANGAKKQARHGLQKDISEIFQGVNIHEDEASAGIVAAQRDLGPDNPMVVSATAQLLKLRRVNEPTSDTQQQTGMWRPQKTVVVVGIAAILAFVAYCLAASEPPPMILVAALFVLYVIGVTIGIVHTRRVANRSQPQQTDAKPDESTTPAWQPVPTTSGQTYQPPPG